MADSPDTIVFDVYPWPVPTDAQKRWFDALPPEEKRRLITEAIADGFASGVSDMTIDDIAQKVLKRSDA